MGSVYLVIFFLPNPRREFHRTCVGDFLFCNWWYGPLFTELLGQGREELFGSCLPLVCLKKCGLPLFQPGLLFFGCPLSTSHVRKHWVVNRSDVPAMWLEL